MDDYANFVLEHRRATQREEKAAAKADKEPAINKKEARRQEAQERQRIAQLRKPLQQKLARIEKQLAERNATFKALEERLADPNFYTDTPAEDVQQVLREHGELKPVIEALELDWLTLSEEIEAIH